LYKYKCTYKYIYIFFFYKCYNFIILLTYQRNHIIKPTQIIRYL